MPNNVLLQSSGITSTIAGVTGAPVTTLEGYEKISQLFSFDITIITGADSQVDVNTALTSPATLVFNSDSGQNTQPRILYGMISEIDALMSIQDQGQSQCRVKFVPRMWKMTLTQKTEVFVGLTVPQIIKTKFGESGFIIDTDDPSNNDCSLSALLNSSMYPQRQLVIQYNESDFAFVSRLAEHLGISFYFQHDTTNQKDVVVFIDASSTPFNAISSNGVYSFGNDNNYDIYKLSNRVRKVPQNYRTNDYDPTHPTTSFDNTTPVTSPTVTQDSGVVFEFGPNVEVGVVTPPAGPIVDTKAIATIRSQEMLSLSNVFVGKSALLSASAGSLLDIADTSEMTQNAFPSGTTLLFVSVEHNYDANGLSSRSSVIYENTFEAIPSTVGYRPERLTPKPKVAGVLQAKIEGASADQTSYAQVDANGCYTIRMLTDGTVPVSNFGSASNAVVMAQPHGGNGYGFHFPLRIGVVVLVACVEGDPDRPIIVGVVPNAVTTGPVTTDNSKRNVIRTGALNEVNFDDTQGQERITLFSPFQNTFVQLGAAETTRKPNLQEQGALVSTGGSVSIGANVSISDIAQQLLGFAGTLLSSVGSKIFHLASQTASQTVTNLLQLTSGQQQNQMVNAASLQAANQANQNATNQTQQLWSAAQQNVAKAQGQSAVSFGNPDQLLITLAEQVAAFVASNGTDGNAFVTAQQVLSLYGKSAAQLTSDQSIVVSSGGTLIGYAQNDLLWQSAGTLELTSEKAATYTSNDATSFSSQKNFAVTSQADITMTASSANIQGNAQQIQWTGSQSVVAGTDQATITLNTSSAKVAVGAASTETTASGITVNGGSSINMTATNVSIAGAVTINGSAVTVSGGTITLG